MSLLAHPMADTLVDALVDLGVERVVARRELEALGTDGSAKDLFDRLEMDSLDQLDCALTLEALAGRDLGDKAEGLFHRKSLAQSLDIVGSAPAL